jgi:carbon monoxide dehydrogenase subunit G
MPISVPVHLQFEFAVKAPATEVFDLLSDTSASAGFYPKVDKLIDLGEGAYRWEMEKLTLGPATLQTIYACKYVSDKAAGKIGWTPVQGENDTNTSVTGSWKIIDNKTSTNLVLTIDGVLTLPLPGLMKLIVAPVAEKEFRQLTQKYIDNISQHLGGKA